MKRLFLFSVVSFSLAISGLTACDESSSSSSTTLPSLSNDVNKPISEVTTQEAKAWCEVYAEKASNVMDDETTCELAGFMAASMAGDAGQIATVCAQVRDDCMKNPDKYQSSDPEDQTEEINCDGTSNEDYKDCDATVGEFDACFSAMLAETKKATDKVSCNMSADDMTALMGMQDFGPDKVPACAPLLEKCPDVFDSEDTEQPEMDVMTQDDAT